jgi:glycosyltransferase involved in cell wall biosynthesis
VAKDQNVRLRSGWFSERAVCYLASGKPVVTQDTGFGNVLPTGEGLFAVGDVDEAAAAVDEINSDYRRHCDAARAIAREHFAAPAVAGRLLAALGL